MNLPIIQSILHGSLKPNLCNLNFMELESKFEKLPDYLTKLEKLFISNFPDHKFDFDDERLISALKTLINYDEYTNVILHLLTTFSFETLSYLGSEMLFYVTDTFLHFDILRNYFYSTFLLNSFNTPP